MKVQQQSEFTILTPKNVAKIARDLKAGKGIILIADLEYYSSPSDRLTGKFYLHLFDRPTINLEEKTLNTRRGRKKVGGEDYQTGWERDREYRLRPKPQPRKKDPRESERQQRLARFNGHPLNLDELYDRARDFFQRLSIGEGYEFEISMQSCICRDLGYEKGLALYIPRSVSPHAGLTYALKWMTTKWNRQRPHKGWPEPFKFTEKHIEEMVSYALEDLNTGAVLKHNVKAGVEADTSLGLS